MGASDIAAARKRPGMYVGDTQDGSGARHMLWEAVANALDEHLAGRATRISVTIDADDTIHVDDDGAGIPVHLVDGVPFPQVALTSPHRSGTLDGHAPHAHVGLHGIGIFVVNALSSELVIESFRDGGHHRQRYVQGMPEGPLERIAATTRHGTRVTFRSDPGIFASTRLDSAIVARRLHEMALLNAGLHVELSAPERADRWHHPEGLAGAFAHPAEAVTCRGVAGDVRVDVALSWTESSCLGEGIQSFANVEPTTEHGAHVEGLLLGIAAAGLPAAGLSGLVHVNLADPHYAGPTKDRLLSPQASDSVRSVVADQLRARGA